MENKFKYIVYQTINIVNNKIYIGVHKTKDTTVFDGYLGCGVRINWPSSYMNPKTPFQYAVKKYGPSSFRRSILYIYENEEDAYITEATIVTEQFIQRSDTYNAALGGKINQLYITKNINKAIYQFNRQGKLIKKWDNIYDVSDFLETWKDLIYNAISRRSRLYGSYWAYTPEIDITSYSSPNEYRHVYKYNKDGKCVAIFDSIGQAAKYENIQPGHIIQRVKEGSFSQNGFYFSYKLYDNYIPKPRLDLKNAYVYLYDLSGCFVEKISVKELKKRYKIHSYKEISNRILNNETIYGFQIKTQYSDKIKEYKPLNKKRSVIVYTMTGELVKEYESVTSACKELKLDSSTVSRILRGCAKSTKGYTIKYKTEDIV